MMDQLVKWAGLADHQNSCEKKFMELKTEGFLGLTV